jgi:hypothetical protein
VELGHILVHHVNLQRDCRRFFVQRSRGAIFYPTHGGAVQLLYYNAASGPGEARRRDDGERGEACEQHGGAGNRRTNARDMVDGCVGILYRFAAEAKRRAFEIDCLECAMDGAGGCCACCSS